MSFALVAILCLRVLVGLGPQVLLFDRRPGCCLYFRWMLRRLILSWISLMARSLIPTLVGSNLVTHCVICSVHCTQLRT